MKILALLLFPSIAFAQATPPPYVQWTAAGAVCTTAPSGCKVLSAVAATASSANRTFTIPVAHLKATTVQIDYTHSSGTAVTLTCTASLSGGNSYASVTSTNIQSGTGTVSPYNDSWTTSVSGGVLLDYTTARYDHLKCTEAVTGGGSGDTVNVYVVSAPN